jgi:hypothetical protein
MNNKIRLDKGQIEVMDEQMAAILKRKSPAERISIGFEIWLSAQRMLKASLETTHRNWSQEQIDKETARRLSHGAV